MMLGKADLLVEKNFSFTPLSTKNPMWSHGIEPGTPG